MTTRGKSNLPINYEEQLKKEAAEIQKRLAAPSGDRIRSAGKGFVTPDGNEGDVIEGVITEFISANMYYDSPYDAANPKPPACFALGTEPQLMVPSDNSPAKQSQTCATCPQNQYGSAGRGKACKNTRLLAYVPVGSEDDTAPIWIYAVPPSSIKFFDSYVSGLANKQQTIPCGVVTSMSMDPTETYAAPRFKAVRPLTQEEFPVFLDRRDEARSRLMVEPDVSEYVPPRGAAATRRAR